MPSVVQSHAVAHGCDAAPLPSQVRDRTVLWLDGEHDVATAADLKRTLASLISADNSDLIVDLSGVTFLSAATIDELLRGRDILLTRSRNLTLRSPSRWVAHLLDCCGLTDLVERAERTSPSSVLQASSRAAGLAASNRASREISLPSA